MPRNAPRRKSRPHQDLVLGDAKVFALLAYLPFLCILPLLFKKDNVFVLSHGKQGLVIFVAEIAVFIIHIILGQWILRLGMFVLLGLAFAGLIAVLRGRPITLPVVSRIADQITL